MLATLPPAQAAVAADAGALVTFFGRATLGQVEGSAEELGRAGSLLGDAMAVLRRHFAAALAATAEGAAAAECRRHLDAAMVALQCEDALLQMLRSLERRTLQTADALRHVVSLECEASASVTEDRCGPVVPEELAQRLRAATTMLATGIVRAGPVMQEKAVAGSFDMF
jgi:hypothetical protein